MLRTSLAALLAATVFVSAAAAPQSATKPATKPAPQSAPQAKAEEAGEAPAAFMTRCRAETLKAWPGAKAQLESICGSKWGEAVAAAPIANALLAAAPAPGAKFVAANAQKAAAALKGFTASAKAAPPTLSINWYADGEPIPFNIEDALRARGAALTNIACLSYGASEGARAWRVAAPGKAPFALTVNFRNAAVASQSSDFTTTGDYSGKMPTLAALKRDGSEWTETCPA